MTFLLACIRLMRADRPVGTVLLACPMLWALWLAADGQPSADIVLVFLLGAFVMRSAGCVINDFADRKIDAGVKRTQSRPLAAGDISAKAALGLFAVLIACAVVLLLFLLARTFWVAVLAVCLATLYPFTKRFFIMPQLVLGLAYSSSILMAYVAVAGEIPAMAWWLFIASGIWTVVYDTFYAMVDRDDDVHLGIHSSALWFGHHERLIMGGLTMVFIAMMAMVGVVYKLNGCYYLGLVFAVACFVFQFVTTRHRSRDACFAAFLNNQWVGVLIFLGILLSYLPE